jgi:hypothetical protein
VGQTMDKNLNKYLKRVKMTVEMFRVETKIDNLGLKWDKISFKNELNLEELYKNAYESIFDDDIKYKELFLKRDNH